MKKIFVLLLLFVLTSMGTVVMSQSTSEKITVNTSDLTADQLAKITAEKQLVELEKKYETYGKWVGVGGEIGTAIKEGLSSVVDVADKFGGTQVGKFTMIMIAWKIIGKDILIIVFGVLFATIFTIFIFKYHKNNFTTHRIVVEDNGWKFWLPKKYEIVRETTGKDKYEGYELVKWLNIVMLIGGYAITYAIMFG